MIVRPPRLALVGIILALVLVPIGCAAPPGTPLGAEWKMSDTGITLSPPGNAVPTISSDAAYTVCLTGAAACGPGSPTAIQLALATDTGSGELDSSGTLQLTLNNTLVWAISWLGIPCPPNNGVPAIGGGGLVSVTPSPSGSSNADPTVGPLCVAFVDARSGTFYFTETGPHQ